ncbi:MAG: type I 3-dehydroquinate dehydratase [Bacteroidales bacterium]|nr:type I 3-dehydroquinate dehydratase [Bacteroidales bacterium]
MVNSTADLANLFSLYNRTNERLVALGMGEMGKISRVMALVLGAEFTFAAPNNGQPTAPGQLSKQQLMDILENINTR